VLHLDIRADVLALVCLSLRQPLGKILVTLRLVDIVRNAKELWTGDAGIRVSNCEKMNDTDGSTYSLAKASR